MPNDPQVTQPGGTSSIPGAAPPARIGLIPVRVEYPFEVSKFYRNAYKSVSRSTTKRHAEISNKELPTNRCIDGVLERFGNSR